MTLWLLTLVGLVVFGLILANAWVIGAARPYVYDDIQRLPPNEVGLVLGTSPYTRYGSKNLLFRHRIEAAAELYRAGKVETLLLSGANPDETYNEPRKMREALKKAGVPGDVMTLDPSGFRTLDSVVRAQRLFDHERFTIISQRFHNYRAVFLARQHGSEAVAFARPEEDRRQPLRTEVREFFARAKAVLDVYVLGQTPRVLRER